MSNRRREAVCLICGEILDVGQRRWQMINGRCKGISDGESQGLDGIREIIKMVVISFAWKDQLCERGGEVVNVEESLGELQGLEIGWKII